MARTLVSNLVEMADDFIKVVVDGTDLQMRKNSLKPSLRNVEIILNKQLKKLKYAAYGFCFQLISSYVVRLTLELKKSITCLLYKHVNENLYNLVITSI